MSEEFELLEEDVVFSPAKHEQDIAESPSAVTVITREQIENTPCTSVACLLRQIPEVHVKQVKPMHTAVGARALTGEGGDRILVLIDGREVNIEIFGPPFWESLPVHLEDIERIEVIRGPGSALYGANAHSMVVSILTRKITADASELFLGGGEHSAVSHHLRLERILGDWRLHLSASHEASGSFQTPGVRERQLNRFRLRLQHQGRSSTSDLELGLTTPEGVMHLGLCLGEIQNAALGHLLVSHQAESWIGRISFSGLTTDLAPDLPLFFGGVELGKLPRTISFVHTGLDAELQADFKPAKGNLLIVGGNYRWTMFLSDDNRPEENHQHRVGLFLHDEQRLLDDFLLTAGVRVDDNNVTGLTVSPRAAGIWRFSKGHSARLSLGRSYWKPPFINTSIHIKNVTGIKGIGEFIERSIGNENLAAEKLTALEAGYLGHFWDDRLTLEADLFLHWYRDSLGFFIEIKNSSIGFPDLENSRVEYRNIGADVDTLGGSVSLSFRIRDSFRVAANYSWRINFVSSGSSIGQDGAGDDPSSWISSEPGQVFNLSASYQSAAGLRTGVNLHAASANHLFWSKDGSLFGEMGPIVEPPRLFANGFLGWRVTTTWGWVETGVRVFDLFGLRFRDTPSVTRADGKQSGGDWMSRLIFVFFRGSL